MIIAAPSQAHHHPGVMLDPAPALQEGKTIENSNLDTCDFSTKGSFFQSIFQFWSYLSLFQTCTEFSNINQPWIT